MSMNRLFHSRLDVMTKGARTLVAQLLFLVVLTLSLAACDSAAAGTIATPTAPAGQVVPSSAVPTDSPTPAGTATPLPITTPTIADTPTSVPTTLPTTPAAGATVTASSATAPSSAVANAIQSVIQQANQEEQQALAANDPTLMSDTATTAYYNQMVQAYNDMVNSGVTAIQLVNLTWGPITLQDATTAQATTVETWNTTFVDGGTLQATDTNVYTLVLQSGAWKVQADEFPNSRLMQLPPGTPGTSPAVPTPVVPLTPLASGGVGQSQSRNWAGYAASGGTFTVVSGTWTVPSISLGSSSATATDATWVGIGGVTTTDLIQAGTQATVQAGQVVYSAWWETLPQASQTVALNLNAGDRVTVSITQQPDGTWQILIRDETSGDVYQNNLTYASSLSSAEWIEEAPATGRRSLSVLPLDNFGTVTFTQATTVENGQQRTIAQAGGQSITMDSTAGQALAQPSALGADGASFSVTRTNTPAPGTGPGGGYVPNKILLLLGPGWSHPTNRF